MVPWSQEGRELAVQIQGTVLRHHLDVRMDAGCVWRPVGMAQPLQHLKGSAVLTLVSVPLTVEQ